MVFDRITGVSGMTVRVFFTTETQRYLWRIETIVTI